MVWVSACLFKFLMLLFSPSLALSIKPCDRSPMLEKKLVVSVSLLKYQGYRVLHYLNFQLWLSRFLRNVYDWQAFLYRSILQALADTEEHDRLSTWSNAKMPLFSGERLERLKVRINLFQPVDSMAPGLCIVGFLVQTHGKEESISNWPQVNVMEMGCSGTSFNLAICILLRERIEGIELFFRLDAVYGYQSSSFWRCFEIIGVGKGRGRKQST